MIDDVVIAAGTVLHSAYRFLWSLLITTSSHSLPPHVKRSGGGGREGEQKVNRLDLRCAAYVNREVMGCVRVTGRAGALITLFIFLSDPKERKKGGFYI